MTDEDTLLAIPGGKELQDHFGRVPNFHDAYLLELTLASTGPSVMRLHGWNMNNRVDEKGYFISEKHAVVTLTLEGVTRIALESFDMIKAIIASLEIAKHGDEYEVSWTSSYGVDGAIRARQPRFELVPGWP